MKTTPFVYDEAEMERYVYVPDWSIHAGKCLDEALGTGNRPSALAAATGAGLDRF